MINSIWKKKDSTGFMILLFGSSQMISNALRIIAGLIIAKFVVPDLLGLFNGFGLILGYLPILQIGMMNGLNRELPFLLGKQDIEGAKRVASVTQFWEILLAILVSSTLLILALVKLLEGNYLFFTGFFTYSFISLHHFYVTNYLQILFRTNNDFNKLSLITLVISILALVLLIPVWKWNFYGLCVRLVCLSLVEFLLLWHFRPLRVTPHWDFIIFKKIIKVGIPIFIVGYLFSLWSVLQNTFVLKFGGTQQYGFFALAIMVESSLLVLINSVNQIIYPKLAFEYGKGTTLSNMIRITIKPIIIILAILIPSVSIIWFILPQLVNWWLPQYAEGISAAKWTLITVLIAVFSPVNLFFNVIKKQRDYLISIIIGILTFSVLLYVLFEIRGFNLINFPQAMLLGKTCQLLMAAFFIHSYRKISFNNAG